VDEQPIVFEARRKLLHLIPLVIPLLSTLDLVNETHLLIILACCAAAAFSVEVARRYPGPVRAFFIRFFGSFLRHDERKQPVGSTYFFAGLLLSVLLFPRLIAEASMYVLIVGDTMAAIVGSRWGTHHVGKKTLEGSLAFFLSSLLVLILLGRVDPAAAAAGVFAAALVELMPLGVNDNFTIPVSSGVVMYLMS
jgi:dolichol kinase